MFYLREFSLEAFCIIATVHLKSCTFGTLTTTCHRASHHRIHGCKALRVQDGSYRHVKNIPICGLATTKSICTINFEIDGDCMLHHLQFTINFMHRQADLDNIAHFGTAQLHVSVR
jgi:hypothetical protein